MTVKTWNKDFKTVIINMSVKMEKWIWKIKFKINIYIKNYIHLGKKWT